MARGRVDAVSESRCLGHEEGNFALHKPLLVCSRRLHTAKWILLDASVGCKTCKADRERFGLCDDLY